MRENKEAVIRLLKDLGVTDYIINDTVKQGFSLNYGELKQVIVYDRHLFASHGEFEKLGYGITNRTRENIPVRNGNFIIERRGTSRSFHGWDDDAKFHVDLCIHIPKRKFMLDVESEGNRVACQVFDSIEILEDYMNRILEGKQSGSRLVLSKEIKDELTAELSLHI